MKSRINRLKIVLAEQQKTNKWLAEAVDKSQVTISRWVTNDQQPNLYDLRKVAKALDVDIRELIEPTKKKLNNQL